MIDIHINRELVKDFEAGLLPKYPEKNVIPTRVLGYGEMSTTLEIGQGEDTALAYKRMPMFQTEAEATQYETVYWDYVQVLQDQVGLQVVSSDLFHLHDPRNNRWIVYLVQQKLPAETIGNKVIRLASASQAQALIRSLLQEIVKVFEFNRISGNDLEVGLDGQISNWAVSHYDVARLERQGDIAFTFFDTGSPLLRKLGEEQLSPEMYLRSAPSFLAWLLRIFFLEDVVNRYYDFREVAIDLLANLYKEQRPDLVAPTIEVVNDFFATEWTHGGVDPITIKEVQAYYRTDAWIWRLYMAFRRVDRGLHRLRGKYYPYILPGKTQR